MLGGPFCAKLKCPLLLAYVVRNLGSHKRIHFMNPSTKARPCVRCVYCEGVKEKQRGTPVYKFLQHKTLKRKEHEGERGPGRIQLNWKPGTSLGVWRHNQLFCGIPTSLSPSLSAGFPSQAGQPTHRGISRLGLRILNSSSFPPFVRPGGSAATWVGSLPCLNVAPSPVVQKSLNDLSFVAP